MTYNNYFSLIFIISFNYGCNLEILSILQQANIIWLLVCKMSTFYFKLIFCTSFYYHGGINIGCYFYILFIKSFHKLLKWFSRAQTDFLFNVKHIGFTKKSTKIVVLCRAGQFNKQDLCPNSTDLSNGYPLHILIWTSGLSTGKPSLDVGHTMDVHWILRLSQNYQSSGYPQYGHLMD